MSWRYGFDWYQNHWYRFSGLPVINIGHISGRFKSLCAGPRLVSSVPGNISRCWGNVKGEKRQTFYKRTHKFILSIALSDTKQKFREHGKMVFYIALEFSDCHEPFVRKLNESGKITGRRKRTTGAQRWLGMATRSTLRAPMGERDPYCSNSARSGYTCHHRKAERCTTSQLS